jgi:hypothetical protein
MDILMLERGVGGGMSETNSVVTGGQPLLALSKPTPWPKANARLLGLGMGLPIQPLERLALFDDSEFERFTLEWAFGYLAAKEPGVVEVQQRGGAGDKGRDVIAWFDPSTVPNRRWHLYQCKHYGAAIGPGVAAGEMAKVIFYTFSGDYSCPEKYCFITHKGVTSGLQDLVDNPENFREFITANWDKYCRNAIGKKPVDLTAELLDYINNFPFNIVSVKQPHEILEEHKKTRYHLTVFGAPLIERPKPPEPPSQVMPGENGYVNQLFEVISSEMDGVKVEKIDDFAKNERFWRIFDRARIMFYCAEGLKELARDQMASEEIFKDLLNEFCQGLYYWYSEDSLSGLQRLINTIKASQQLDLGAHALAPHVIASDREGMCHQLANEQLVKWCQP